MATDVARSPRDSLKIQSPSTPCRDEFVGLGLGLYTCHTTGQRLPDQPLFLMSEVDAIPRRARI